MSVNKVNSDGSLSRVAGGTLYADLPIGSWVKNDSNTIPSGFLKAGDSISQTLYPELYAIYGSTVPYKADTSELSDWEEVSNVSSVTALYDGYMSCTGYHLAYYVKVNDVVIGREQTVSNGHANLSFPIKKGDVVGFYNSNDNSSISLSPMVAYYKKSLIVKAKQVAVPADFLAKVDEAVEDVYGDIIPSDASASNQLVTHQTPYESFTLNNSSSSQKWYKLGTYTSGNNTVRLDFVSARVDGQMFESSVRISGVGADANYVSWIGENGSEISIFAIKVDTNRNLYMQMNSYSAVEIRVYGAFTLNIAEQSSTPSGAGIPLQKLVTESDISYLSSNKLMYHQETGAAVLYLAAYHWQLPVNTTYLVHITAGDKNSPGDNYDGIVKFTYGGTSSTITNISYYKLSGTGTIDAVNSSGTIQFSFSNGLPEICVAFMG